jgi:hypothetical protein
VRRTPRVQTSASRPEPFPRRRDGPSGPRWTAHQGRSASLGHLGHDARADGLAPPCGERSASRLPGRSAGPGEHPGKCCRPAGPSRPRAEGVGVGAGGEDVELADRHVGRGLFLAPASGRRELHPEPGPGLGVRRRAIAGTARGGYNHVSRETARGSKSEDGASLPNNHNDSLQPNDAAVGRSM